MKTTIPYFYVSRWLKHGFSLIKNSIFNIFLVSILSFSAFAQIPTGNLFLRFNFEGDISDAVNSTPIFTNGTPTFATDRFGAANSAIVFNGTDQYFRSDAEIAFTPDFTVSFWIKTTSTQGGVIFTRGNQQGDGSHDRKFVLRDDGTMLFGVWIGGYATVNSTTMVNDGAWHHVVASHTTIPAGFKLYIDGVLEGTSTNASTDGNNGYMVVGNGGNWGYSTDSYFNGQLDELLYYKDKALSSVEVASIFYNNPSTFLSNNELNFDVSGSSSLITVTSAIGLEVATPAHITASPSTIGTGVTVVTFTASVFNNSIPVSSEISVTGTNYNSLISANYNIVFSSNPAMIGFPVAGGSQLVTVTSNVPMNIMGDANVSVLPASISSSVSVITVTALSNTKYATVYGQLNFTAGNASRKIDYSIDQFTGNIPNDLLVYEPFDYAEGKVVLSNISGGIGFTGSISLGDNGGSNSSANKFSIKKSPVVDYTGLASKGNYFVGGSGGENGLPVVRSIDLADSKIAPFINSTDNTIGKAGTTLYTSFVLAKTAPYFDHEVTLTLFNGTNPFNGSGNKLVEFGYFANSTTNYGGPFPIQILEGNNTTFTGDEVTITQNTSNLMVLKIAFGATQHTITGYVNPAIDGIEPSSPSIGPILFSGFDANTSGFSNIAWSLGNDANGDAGFAGSGAIDEIRVATTYQAAVPNVTFAISPVGNITTILGNGTSVQFESVITSANAGDVSWSSVSIPDGNVTIDPTSALLSVVGNAAGTVTITGSISAPVELNGSYVLTIIPATVSATGIAISGAASGNVNNGETTVLSVSYSPLATNQFGVNWSSSNTLIASVTNGTVSGLAVGTVTITATYGLNSAVKATKVITVFVPVTNVSITGVSSIIKGNSATLTGIVTPNIPTDATLTWSSSNTSVATVNNSGIVLGMGIGTVTVTAASVSNPSIKGMLIINIQQEVIDLQPGIVLYASSNAINSPQGTLQIMASITGSSSSVIYSVSDPSIADIDSLSGLLTSKSNGIVVVTGKLSDNTTLTGSIVITVTGQLTGIKAFVDQGIVIYPIPASKVLNIKVEGGIQIKSISLVNIYGTEVYTQAGIAAITVDNLSKGIYYLKAVSDAGMIIKKVTIE